MLTLARPMKLQTMVPSCIVPGSAGEESIETKDGYKKSLAYRKAAELQKQWSVEVVRRISQ